MSGFSHITNSLSTIGGKEKQSVTHAHNSLC
jgi:hypothetical protein